MWSAHDEEQALLAPTRSAAVLPTRRPSTRRSASSSTTARPSKLDYYLDYDVDVESTALPGRPAVPHGHVDLRSRVPADPSAALTTYIAPNVVGIPRGHDPHDGCTSTPRSVAYLAGATSTGRTGAHHAEPRADGRVVDQTVDTRAGREHTLTYDMVAGKRADRHRTDLRCHPGVRSTGIGAVEPLCMLMACIPVPSVSLS